MNSKKAKEIRTNVFAKYYGMSHKKSENGAEKKDIKNAKAAIVFKSMCRAAKRLYMKTGVVAMLMVFMLVGCGSIQHPAPEPMYVNSFHLAPGEYDRSPLGAAIFMAKDSSIKAMYVHYNNGVVYWIKFDSVSKSIQINKIK